VVVDVKAVEPLPRPVTLDAIKAEPKLKAMMLVNNTRLSVQPVTADEWKIVCKMGGYNRHPEVAAEGGPSQVGYSRLAHLTIRSRVYPRSVGDSPGRSSFEARFARTSG